MSRWSTYSNLRLHKLPILFVMMSVPLHSTFFWNRRVEEEGKEKEEWEEEEGSRMAIRDLVKYSMTGEHWFHQLRCFLEMIVKLLWIMLKRVTLKEALVLLGSASKRLHHSVPMLLRSNNKFVIVIYRCSSGDKSFLTMNFWEKSELNCTQKLFISWQSS